MAAELRNVPRGPEIRGLGGRDDWRLGVRLGPDANGLLPRKADSVTATPQGVRKTSAAEMIAFFRAGEQVGFPPPISSGASLGFSAAASQSAEILFDSLCGAEFILVRLEGAAKA